MNTTLLRLILDTNRVVAALISKNSVIRDILRSTRIKFFCPEHMIEEIEKHKEYILQKSGLSENEFYFTLYYLLRRVTIVQKKAFQKNFPKAQKILENVDLKDSPFLALAMTVPNNGIFSDDFHFDATDLKRWSVEDILKWLETKT